MNEEGNIVGNEILQELFLIVYKNMNEILIERGISLLKPKLILGEYPNIKKHSIQLREFKTPYLNKDDEVGGNLYNWIHQSYSVLWETNPDKNEITLFLKTNNKLAERFAMLLKINPSTATKSIIALSMALSLSELCWGLHLKSNLTIDVTDNKYYTANIKKFVFCLANLTLVKDENHHLIFNKFNKMFGKNLDVTRCSRLNESFYN